MCGLERYLGQLRQPSITGNSLRFENTTLKTAKISIQHFDSNKTNVVIVIELTLVVKAAKNIAGILISNNVRNGARTLGL